MQPTTEPLATAERRVMTERLDIVVPYTTPCLTQRALAEADRLAGSTRHRMRVLRIHEIPIYLSMDSTAIPIECLRGELLKFKADHEFYGELMLTRDIDQSWGELVAHNRVLVIASERHVLRTREERFARRMARMGHKVIVVYGG